ncbi:MAG: oxidoreductase-like domain-containing protein [Burkholderiales bacterium]
MKTRPVAPREPLPEECCGKGCTPCVFDAYAEALERYKAELKKARAEDARARGGRRSPRRLGR